MRSYEVDRLGHLNQAVYHSYAEHARVQLLRAAGVSLVDAARLGTVVLESHIRFLHELVEGDEVDVTAGIVFGEGKTFRMDSTIIRTDGVVAAEVTCTMGLMDLTARRLVAEPKRRLASMATNAGLLDGGGAG
ncbi:MAG: acyl-CoA thioesterase [Acidimicrobiales bacterium]